MYTDYVATRWYRAPELLVGDVQYGSAVDVWAIGCVVAEMITGRPLWPGKSDIDQLYRIVQNLGCLTEHFEETFSNNSYFAGLKVPTKENLKSQPLANRFQNKGQGTVEAKLNTLKFLEVTLVINPDNRPGCTSLLDHSLFTATANEDDESWRSVSCRIRWCKGQVLSTRLRADTCTRIGREKSGRGHEVVLCLLCLALICSWCFGVTSNDGHRDKFERDFKQLVLPFKHEETRSRKKVFLAQHCMHH